MKYLFWNTYRNADINSILSDLIVENKISVVILAEYVAEMDELIKLLSLKGVSMMQYPTTGCDRICILGKISLAMKPQLQTDYYSIQIIDDNLVLCCVHLNSQIFSGNAEYREIVIERIIFDVENLEKELKSNNTVIVGDFNVNPYDQTCVNARYFHSLPVYEETKRKSRTVAGKEFKMFYNPMWNLMGDFDEPYGTYYYNSNNAISTYWNFYDQVIIRPALRERFIDENLKILTKTERISLLDDKMHPNHNISDHLPIIFEIKENNHVS